MGSLMRIGALAGITMVSFGSGCSSSGEDLFDGQAAPGVDGGSATGGGTSGGTGGSATGGTGGTDTGGTGGTATGGTGGTATGGTGGTATGGTGGTATGGTGGTAAGGTGGTAAGGTGGAGPVDCADPCDALCNGGTWDTACSDCADTVCLAERNKLFAAPSAVDLQSCWNACGSSDGECWSDCCSDHAQACDAAAIYWDCICGWDNVSCKSSCSDACTGGVMYQACQSCVESSPCATEFYDYNWSPEAGSYSNCRQNCGNSNACKTDCCTKYPLACKERKETVDCICK